MNETTDPRDDRTFAEVRDRMQEWLANERATKYTLHPQALMKQLIDRFLAGEVKPKDFRRQAQKIMVQDEMHYYQLGERAALAALRADRPRQGHD